MSLVLLPGCLSDPPPGDQENRPFRDEWTVVEAAMPFVHTSADGQAQIASITVGGEPISMLGSTNFANRGDVIVQFWDREEILVEARRFTMARSLEAAEDSMALIEVLATSGDITRPDSLAPSADCFAQWQDGCQIRVWQAGSGQEIRSGADLRVTLPRSYRRDIIVETSDVEDSAYHNRGNVCVQGLPGSLEVDVDFGQVFVSLDRDISPAPACDDDALADCVASQWSEDCGCTEQFGRVSLSSRRDSLNAFIDVPRGLWAYVALRGTPSDACSPVVVSDDFVPAQPPGGAVAEGQLAPPVPGEVTALGYQLRATSLECTSVPSTERPLLNDPERNLPIGNAVVYHDQIFATPCEDLLGG